MIKTLCTEGAGLAERRSASALPAVPAPASSPPLLPFPEGCIMGRFLRREKRFSVAVEVEGEEGRPELVWAHTNNTGSMLGLLRPGAAVLLSPAQNPARKLRWTLELMGYGGLPSEAGLAGEAGATGEAGVAGKTGIWVGVNTSVPNRMLEAAFKAGRLPWARGYTRFQREKVRGESRIDALLEGPGLPRLWVECKNVTLVEDGIALFPDAVSARGGKHLRTLAEITQSGERAATFYLVQRSDAACFGAADMIDAAYAEAFVAAGAAGVELYPHQALLSPKGIDLAEKCLKVEAYWKERGHTADIPQGLFLGKGLTGSVADAKADSTRLSRHPQ